LADIFTSQGAPPVSTTPVPNLLLVLRTPGTFAIVVNYCTPVPNLPSVSTTPAANFATSNSAVIDAGGKFAKQNN
jgi:hypothetical protein